MINKLPARKLFEMDEYEIDDYFDSIPIKSWPKNLKLHSILNTINLGGFRKFGCGTEKIGQVAAYIQIMMSKIIIVLEYCGRKIILGFERDRSSLVSIDLENEAYSLS